MAPRIARYLCAGLLLLFVGISQSTFAQSGIKRFEYFIDDDPGYGNATTYTVIPGDVLSNLPVMINPTGLTTGLHAFTIRAQDEAGRWSLNNRLLFLKPFTGALSAPPNMSYAEWFVDDDPGMGNAHAIALSPGANVSNLLVNIDPTTLSSGLHTFIVRARDANGVWSLNNRWLFVKPYADNSQAPLPNITQVEYFIDDDPGTGLATPVAFTPGTNLSDLLINVDPSALSSGLHSLIVRARDANGNWSLASRLLFLKPYVDGTMGPVPQITYAEWYVDDDPGLGNGNSIAITPGTAVTVSVTGDPSLLTNGLHTVTVRAKDANGAWSLNSRWMFLKTDSTTLPSLSNITQLEYFIDNDPGYGKATAVPLTPGTVISDLSIPVVTDTLLPGQHRLSLRAKDARGAWSLINTGTFQVDTSSAIFVTIGTIADSVCVGSGLAVPYRVNRVFNADNVFTAQLSDQNGSFANPVNIGSLTEDSTGTVTATIPANSLRGFNYLVRIIGSSPADTSVSTQRLVVRRRPEQAVGVVGNNNVCIGIQVYNPLNIEPDARYIWTVTGGGTLDTAGFSAIVNWTSAGIHSVLLRTANTCGSGPSGALTATITGSVPVDVPVITSSGRSLFIDNTPTGGSTIQWYRNGNAIPNANNGSYFADSSGTYTVRFINICGAGPASNAIVLSFDVQDQTITFQPLSNKLFGDPPFKLTASASSGLPVVYAIVSGPATITQDTLRILGAGTIAVRASQPGNQQYNAATPITRSFTVAKAFQTVSFDPASGQQPGESFINLIATSSSGLPVNFSVIAGYGKILGNRLTPTGAGRIVVRASQQGNQNYFAADAEISFCIAAQQPGIIDGFTEVCPGRVTYSIEPQAGVSYTWSLTGGGTLLSDNGSTVTIDWTSFGEHTLTVEGNINCEADTAPSRSVVVLVTNALVPASPTNLYPADGTVIQSFPFSVSWKPAANAQVYDVYIWADSTAVPLTPVVNGTKQIGALISKDNLPNYTAGRKYRWKVVSRNACEQAESNVQTFVVPELPNLVVAAIQVPPSIFSGQTIDVTYEIKNIGKESTKALQWYDAVYLSADTILNRNIDAYLGAKPNVSTLNPGQSYINTLRGQLPRTEVGNQYILVQAVYPYPISESDLADNVSVAPLVINLTPPPDLRVTNVVTVGDAFSGQQIDLQYTVKNQGTGDTKESDWLDVIYISPDREFDPGAAIRLTSIARNSVLKTDSSYTRNITLTLPDRSFGMHYLYVVTDAERRVFEFAGENNNTGRSDSINIFLTPPPDLVVTGVHHQQQAATGETIQVDWSVQNIGATKPKDKDRRWYDAVYISKDSVFNSNTDTRLLIQAPLPYPELNHEETYSAGGLVTLPNGMRDTCYLFVVTDYTDQLFEYTGESNNTSARSMILISTPDLVVTNITAPGVGSSGNDITVEWTVKNQGRGTTVSKSRTDQIWLSSTSTFNLATAVSIGLVDYTNPLDTGASLVRQRSITLPNGISGQYYLFIETDRSNTINEGEQEGNNRSTAQPLEISLSPWPDLQVSSVTASSDSIISEKKIGVQYKVINAGAADVIAKSWNDHIYISRDSVWSSRAVLVKSIPRTLLMTPGGSYEVSDSLYISMNLLRSAGLNMANAWFFVWTDPANKIYEYTADTNNIGRSKTLYAAHAEHTDLVMTSVSLPDSLVAGAPSSVNWSVINNGGVTGYYYDYWYDGIYVSKDTVFDSGDRFITDKVLYSPLNKGETYSGSLPFTVPNGLSGNYYLLMVADHKNYNRDKNLKDNYKTITFTPGGGGGTPEPKPIYITLTPSPDLTVTAFDFSPVGTAGQPLLIKWRVLNQGPGATTKGGWTERIYLSRDNVIDPSDKTLGTFARKGNLDSGFAYQDSLEVTLPKKEVGNYYLLFSTDNNDVIYEHNTENNNQAEGTIFIIQPENSDLVITGVHTPAQALLGATIPVQWYTNNLGENPVTGYLRHGVYLSKDSLWSKEDILLSEVYDALQLAPGDSAAKTVQVKVGGVATGHYYAIVRADLADNIFESNEENNTTASVQPIQIVMQQLPLNVLTANTLINNQELYYQLVIPDSLQGETILITLKGDSVAGVNELYVKYGDLPTRSSYDVGYSRALSGNQELIMPAVNKGNYYILVYGATSAEREQPITLLANKINFEILTVASRRGGNTGSVTVRISGAKFESGMQASLFDAGLGSITAHSITYINSTTIFASFNLAGKPVGLYDVKLKKSTGDSTVLPDGFTVETGAGGTLAGGDGSSGGFFCTIKNIGVGQLMDVDVQYPAQTRTRRVFPMVINFGNSSNVDIPVPTRILVSLGGDPVSLSAEGMTEGKKELYIEFKELNGPAGVLRPGVLGSITIFTLSETGRNLKFRLME